MLYTLGITENYVGFHFVGYAIELTKNDPTVLHFITKELYPDVAIRFRVGVVSVERGIRGASEIAFRESRELLERMARGLLKKRPGNGPFIAILASSIKEREEYAEQGEKPA